jgi:gas vesicle protein
MTPRPENESQGAAWGVRERSQSGDRSYASSRAPAAGGERPFPLLQAETGAAFERELLLAEGPADEAERRRPAGTRRGGRLLVGTVLAVVAATATVSFVRERKSWEEKVSAVEAQLTQLSSNTTQNLELLRQEAAEKDKIIAERKADNQKLAALMDKTLVEMKTSIETLRREERERSEKLESECRKALERREPTFADVFRTWVPRWWSQTKN